MAKDAKKAQTPAVQEHTVDNVVELADKKITAEDIMSKEVLDNIKKQDDERTKNAMQSRYVRAAYDRDKTLIDLRRRRSEDEITKKALVLKSDLVDGLMGVDITPEFMQHHGLKDKTEGEIDFLGEKRKVKVGEHISPVINYVDYDKKSREIRDQIAKLSSDARKKHDEEMKKIRASYGDYWSYDWD